MADLKEFVEAFKTEIKTRADVFPKRQTLDEYRADLEQHQSATFERARAALIANGPDPTNRRQMIAYSIDSQRSLESLREELQKCAMKTFAIAEQKKNPPAN